MNLYKCFDNGLINRYGKQFKIGKEYSCDGELKFGNDGNGYHMCTYLEDTLRYFDAMHNSVDICLVKGYGNNYKYDDDYNGFYDMYVFEKMKIIKKLDRKEILDYALKLSDFRLKRFISLYRLNGVEKEILWNNNINNEDILDYIEYYQNDKKDIFKKKILK